ncbi:MAG: proteasome accessory factor PafA2 family protein [bacterium]|nr:proteasome accessory factor PafA2 family protein [bacterium]
MSTQTLMGIETEYACSFTGAVSVSREALLKQHLMSAARQRPHLPDGGSGVFFANGSRFYIDHGLHPEMSTPECPDPWELVRYARAGDQTVRTLTSDLKKRHPSLEEAFVFRSNVDYSGTNATWGCHESYLCRRNLPRPEDLIPHLCSRIIFTGAGGFNTLSPGIEFVISPRAPHLQQDVSGASTHSRGIFHSKDESLASGKFKRLHLLCGECNCSDRALWLKVGTTSLITLLAERGKIPAAEVHLAQPLQAIQIFASDPTLRATVRRIDGRTVTALDLQRSYLETVGRVLKSSVLPDWAAEVYHEWCRTLDALEQDPESTADALDWSIKLALYRQHAERRGVPWQDLRLWNNILKDLQGAWSASVEDGTPMTAQSALAKRSPIRHCVNDIRRSLRHEDLTLDDLGRVLRLRAELFEIDTRYGLLGGGIFEILDEQGVLCHQVHGVRSVDQAIAEPPSVGRAQVRGHLVQELAGTGAYVCQWDTVMRTDDPPRVGYFDNPFATEVRWESSGESPSRPMEIHHDFIRMLRRRRASGDR